MKIRCAFCSTGRCAARPDVPAPSLTGRYLGLRGTSLLAPLLARLGMGATASALGVPGVPLATAGGAITTLAQGGGNELQRILDGMSGFVGLAVFLTWWGLYILGLVNLVVLGLCPIVVLWALFPQAQFRPLATYFAVLLFTTASPLWWALVDSAARLAQGLSPSLWTDPLEWASGHVTYYVVIALGILLIPVITSLLIFGSWRAIGGLWRDVP